MTPATPQRTVRATPRFLKSKRSLSEEVQLEIDERVKAVIADPMLGDPKTGALRGVRVTTFKIGPRQYLLAYTFTPKTNVVEVLDVGVHENFYRDLQNYIDARPG